MAQASYGLPDLKTIWTGLQKRYTLLDRSVETRILNREVKKVEEGC
jgi:hypothetical protein